MKEGSSRPIKAIPLCRSMELRYSVSVTEDPRKQKYAKGYYNAARFYFYSPELKHSIGKAFQLRFPVTNKALKKAAASRPAPPELNKSQFQAGLEGLLNLNANIGVQHMKATSSRVIQAELDQREMLPFWLVNFNSIAALDKSIRAPADLNKAMSRLFFEIASFDLSSLLTANRTELEAACKTLSDAIKRALKHQSDSKTSNIKDKAKIVRYAVELFMRAHDVDPSPALSFLIKNTTPKKGTVAKISDMMRLQSISIGRYRELYAKLTETPDAEHTALLMMVFLGLTAEEVCGLQKQDLQKITGYSYANQAQIIHRYIKSGKEYILTDNEENERSYRNVPLPRSIAQPILDYYKTDSRSSQFLLVKDDRPLKPDELTKKLMELLRVEHSYLTVKDQHGKQSRVDISFQPRSFRVSCRFYWQYHCGLTPGEICYLAGLTPPDTAAAHYIDYNDATMQYRMMKQLEYGLALFANDNTNRDAATDWTEPEKDSFFYAGGIQKRAHLELHIKKPCTVRLSSNRGLVFVKEGEA